MIVKLTAETLKEYGVSERHIGEILNAIEYEQNCTTLKGEYFVSKSEMLIYSGNERFIKTGKPMLMFPFYNINLIPEYFQQLLEVYLKREKTDLGILFNKEKAIERFKQSEISRTNDAIKEQTKSIGIFKSSSLKVKQYRGYIDWLNEVETTASIKPPEKDKKILSYNWQGKTAELNELHKAMQVEFIDKEARVEDFCSIFLSEDITKIKPVKWLKTLTDLLLFLYEMMDAGLIIDERNRMDYKRLQACFLKADGSQFDESFSSIFQQIKKGYTTEKIDIKELIKHFK